MSVSIYKLEVGEVVPKYFETHIPRYEWVKYDIPDLRHFYEVLPQLSARLNSVEEHLATGKPFVRAAERPMVGAEALEAVEQVRSLTKRVAELEGRLQGQNGG